MRLKCERQMNDKKNNTRNEMKNNHSTTPSIEFFLTSQYSEWVRQSMRIYRVKNDLPSPPHPDKCGEGERVKKVMEVNVRGSF